MRQLHEIRTGLAPGALRRDYCQHEKVRTAADRPPPSVIELVPVSSASDWLVPHCGDSIRGTLTLTVFFCQAARCVETIFIGYDRGKPRRRTATATRQRRWSWWPRRCPPLGDGAESLAPRRPRVKGGRQRRQGAAPRRLPRILRPQTKSTRRGKAPRQRRGDGAVAGRQVMGGTCGGAAAASAAPSRPLDIFCCV